MAIIRRYLKPEDFAKANALMVATWGMTPKKRLYTDQIGALTQEAIIQHDEEVMAPIMDVFVGTFRRQRYEGHKIPLIRRHMPFAGRYLYTSKQTENDLVKVAYEVMATLLRNTKVESGFLKSNYNFIINGEMRSARSNLMPPPDGYPDGTVIGITNLAEYAPVHENPGWSRPFYRTWRQVKRRFTQFDFKLSFKKSGPIGGTFAKRRNIRRKYNVPVLEIAQHGELGTLADFVYKKRRPKKVRRGPPGG